MPVPLMLLFNVPLLVSFEPFPGFYFINKLLEGRKSIFALVHRLLRRRSRLLQISEKDRAKGHHKRHDLRLDQTLGKIERQCSHNSRNSRYDCTDQVTTIHIYFFSFFTTVSFSFQSPSWRPLRSTSVIFPRMTRSFPATLSRSINHFRWLPRLGLEPHLYVLRRSVLTPCVKLPWAKEAGVGLEPTTFRV